MNGVLKPILRNDANPTRQCVVLLVWVKSWRENNNVRCTRVEALIPY